MAFRPAQWIINLSGSISSWQLEHFSFLVIYHFSSHAEKNALGELLDINDNSIHFIRKLQGEIIMNFISFYNVVSHTRRDSQDSSIEPSKYQEQN